MKISRKILPALAMLVISAVMLSTASFAWFNISSQATANGMSVSVRSDSAFLVVSNSASIDESYAEYEVSVTDNAKKSLAPTAFDSNGMPEYVSGTALTTTVANAFAAAGNSTVWYTMRGTSDDDGTGTGERNVLANADLIADSTNEHTGYLAKYTVWVAVAPKTNMTMTDLKATLVIPNSGDLSVSALVVGPEGYTHLTNNASGTDLSIEGSEVLLATIDKTPVQIDIYIYYNGNHSNVTTDNYFAGQIFDTVASIQFTAGAAD